MESKPEPSKEKECTAKFEFKYNVGVYTLFSTDKPAIAVSAKNISDKTISYAEVKVYFYDANGELIETKYIYFMGSIKPGDSERMDIMTYPEKCKSCKFVVMDCN